MGDLRNDCGQVAAGAFSADTDRVGIDAQGLGVASGVTEGCHGVLDAGGERVLGSEPVVDRKDGQSGVDGEEAAGGVGGFQIAEDPAAPVVVDQQGRRPVEAGGAVEPGGQRSGRSRHAQVAHPGDREPVTEDPGFGTDLGAPLGQGKLFEGPGCRQAQQSECDLDLGVQFLPVDTGGPSAQGPLHPGRQRTDRPHHASCHLVLERSVCSHGGSQPAVEHLPAS